MEEPDILKQRDKFINFLKEKEFKKQLIRYSYRYGGYKHDIAKDAFSETAEVVRSRLWDDEIPFFDPKAESEDVLIKSSMFVTIKIKTWHLVKGQKKFVQAESVINDLESDNALFLKRVKLPPGLNKVLTELQLTILSLWADQLKYAEIARKQKMTIGNVSNTLSKGRAKSKEYSMCVHEFEKYEPILQELDLQTLSNELGVHVRTLKFYFNCWMDVVTRD